MFQTPCAYVTVSQPGTINADVSQGVLQAKGPDCPAGLGATAGQTVIYKQADARNFNWQGRPYAVVPASSVIGYA